MAKQRYAAVFVSPHLDDAVFSCAGEILRQTARGPVLVLNVFTRYLADVKVRGVVLNAGRYEEEAAAARLLGYASHNFGELDAVFRRAHYQSIANIFRPPVTEDNTYLDDLRIRVFAFLESFDYEHLYLPLGVGWHVDHMLTHVLFQPWFRRAGLWFYEDAPYCHIPNATKYRLAELGAVPAMPEDQTLTPSGALHEWWQTSAGYADTALMRNLSPTLVRWGAVPVVSLYLWRLLTWHRAHKGQDAKLGLRPTVRPLAENLDRKVAAAMLYASQFREFFASRADFIGSHARYAMQLGGTQGPVERYWQPGDVVR